MRIVTYNVEWFNALFDEEGQLREDDGPSARYGVSRREQLAALGIVFTALDADAVMVIEAPDANRHRDTVVMLERFAETCGLRARRALIGFANHTQQEIAFLYDPDLVAVRHDPQGHWPQPPGETGTPRFDGQYRIDLDIDLSPETIAFSKPPLELAVETAGRALRIIGAHVKSKAPIGATTEVQAARIAIENRRKQLAQCIWLRRRVEEHLARGESLIVLGDLNDGPGLDAYEELFGHSGVEIVMGAEAPAELQLHDPHARSAAHGRRPSAGVPASARFWNNRTKGYVSALLDYVMVSPDLAALAPRWRIWHPFDDPACYAAPELRDALLAASDHFPVSLDIAL